MEMLSSFGGDKHEFCLVGEHTGRLARMSVLDTELDGLNPGSSMSFP